MKIIKKPPHKVVWLPSNVQGSQPARTAGERVNVVKNTKKEEKQQDAANDNAKDSENETIDKINNRAKHLIEKAVHIVINQAIVPPVSCG